VRLAEIALMEMHYSGEAKFSAVSIISHCES